MKITQIRINPTLIKRKVICDIINPIKLNETKLKDLNELINSIYHHDEDTLIDPSLDRTSPEELSMLIEKRELFIVELDGKIVASIHLQNVDKDTHKFGMLVTHPDYRYKGIASKLISFCENKAKENGSKYMSLDLLKPKEWTHEQKEYLENWYQRIGYIKSSLNDFPIKENLLTPCDFFEFIKIL